MLDGNSNTGSPPGTNSVGIQVVSGDTSRYFGTVIQFFDTGWDVQGGEGHEAHGVRFEGTTTGANIGAVSDTKVFGGSFNNYISGGTGVGVNIAAGATKTAIVFRKMGSLTNNVVDASGDTSSLIYNDWKLGPASGALTIGDAKLIRVGTGAMRALDNFSTNLNLVVGAANNKAGATSLLFGSAQDAGLTRLAVKVVGPKSGTTTALGAFTTAGRLSATAVPAGSSYFDTTLNKPIWSTGSAWVDVSGATA